MNLLAKKLLFQKILSAVGGYGMLYNWFCTQAQSAVEYGYLYNWYAATDSRNICSVGWHVPTNSDFSTLATYLGGTTIAGGKLKETGTIHWLTPNTGATNEVGFNGKGVGLRQYSGGFNELGLSSRFWTTETYYDYGGRIWQLIYNNDDLITPGGLSFKSGLSIRTVKDSTTLTNGQTGTYVDPSGIIYPTICIGTQEWVACNIMTKHYRNGDAIPEVTDNTAWAALTTGARCSYNNTESNAGTTKKISSSDSFIVPDNVLWSDLFTYVGSGDYLIAGGKLKETGLSSWDEPNVGATNEFGFNSKGSGFRLIDGSFYGYHIETNYQSNDPYFYVYINNNEEWAMLDNLTDSPIPGLSIRLCNPTTLNAEGSVNSYTQNDGTEISTIVINGVEWTMNLKETKWSDGTDISNVTDNTAWSLLQSAACCDIDNDPTKR